MIAILERQLRKLELIVRLLQAALLLPIPIRLVEIDNPSLAQIGERIVRLEEFLILRFVVPQALSKIIVAEN